jgi:Flp pilus assembly protein TadD
MSETNARYGRLITLLAAGSLLGACAQGMGGSGKGSSVRLAERSADAGDFQTAATFYQQAFDANPRSVEALVGLGRSYTGLGQYARAEQALVEAQNRRPGDPEVLLELARTQLASGQAEAALGNLDVALRKRPRDVQIITARGIALDRLSRHAEAQETYRRGLAIDPTNFVLMSNLGLSLGLSGQTGEGITILRELVRDGAATANTRGNLALVYGLAGREREASATLAVDLSPSQIQNNLAYYRSLREMLRQGRPIGNLDAPGQKPAAKPRGNAVGKAPAAPAAEAPKLAAAGPATAPAPGAPRGGAVESLGIMEPPAAALAPRAAAPSATIAAAAEAAIEAVEAAPVVLPAPAAAAAAPASATPARAGAQ